MYANSRQFVWLAVIDVNYQSHHQLWLRHRHNEVVTLMACSRKSNVEQTIELCGYLYEKPIEFWEQVQRYEACLGDRVSVVIVDAWGLNWVAPTRIIKCADFDRRLR